MPFVQQSGREHECHGSQFSLDGIEFFKPEGAKRHERKDAVFRDMCAFPDEDMPEIDLMGCQPREKVGQRWNDDPRGLINGECIRGKEKHGHQPDQDGQLIFE
jgi:hypothetical protein